MAADPRSRLIARLDPTTRLEVLDGIASSEAAAHGVVVEHSPWRKLDEADTTAGRIIAVARSLSSSDIELVIQPFNPRLRAVAIPAAHVCRVRRAVATPLPSQADQPDDTPRAPRGRWPVRYGHRTSEVLAGPPLGGGGRVAIPVRPSWEQVPGEGPR